MGGRQSDTAGSDLRNPREYDPGTDTWTTKVALLPDNQTNNMVGGVLNIGGTDYIVVVGGSAAGATTATDSVKIYDPVADAVTVDTTDPWPGGASGIDLPGGAAVVDNKLYVFGGFSINVGMVDTMWEYDPAGADGSRWTLKSAVLAQQLGYVPAANVGGQIYMAGGSIWTGSTIDDTNVSEVYDPVADSMTPIATIPRVTAETRAVAEIDDTVWVLGGGRNIAPPNPSAEVDVYDTVGNGWRTGPPMPTAKRNFAADVDEDTGRIFTAGGYDSSGTVPITNNEIYNGCVVFTDGFERGNTTRWSQAQP